MNSSNIVNYNFDENIIDVYKKSSTKNGLTKSLKEYDFLAIKGSRMSGKSFYAKERVLENALMGYSTLVVRNESGTNEESTFAELVELLELRGIPYTSVRKPTPRIKIAKSVIIFGGMNRSEKFKSMKPLNANPISLIWFEEAVEILEKNSLKEALSIINKIRFTFRDAVVKGEKIISKIILTYNPDKPNHWLKNYEEKGNFVFCTTLYDNPYANKEMIKVIEEYKTTWPEYYNMVARGEWMNLGDKVYLDIKDVDNEQEIYDKLFIGIDIGFNDDTAFVLVGKINNEYHVLQERSFNQKDFYEIESELHAFLSGIKYYSNQQTRIIVETATGGKMFIKTLKSKLDGRYKILKANKKYKLSEGIFEINNLISFNKFKIKHDLKVYKEYSNLTYDKNNKPTDGNNHNYDASRYAISYDIYRKGN